MKAFKIILCCVFLTSSVVLSEGDESAWSAKVSVGISAPPALASEIESYVKRELRGLHDVSIEADLSSSPDYLVEIVAVELENKAGTPTGYALSTVVVSPLSSDYISLVVSTCGGNTNAYPGLIKSFSKYSMAEKHDLRITDLDGLKTACEKIVAAIDSDCFETARKNQAQIMAFLKKINKSEPAKTNAPYQLTKPFVSPKSDETITNSP